MTYAKLRHKKRGYQSAKIKHFLNFHARKPFFQAHIQSGIDCASTLWDSASDSLQKPLRSPHRWAVTIVLLKRTSLTDKDYKAAQILPLSSKWVTTRVLCTKLYRVGHRCHYSLSTKLLINQSSRNSSRKLNVPIPRIDLFKSSLVYSGPVLWNWHCPVNWGFQSVLQRCLKSILRFICCLS